MILTLDLVTNYAEGEAIRVSVPETHRFLVLVRLGHEVYVLDDRCSHEDFPLSDGLVDTDQCEIECSRHGAMFALATGEAVTFPATTPVRRYEVQVVEGRVVVTV
jgi:3-phenylpropionate/trans-cinnamate dioxygenase ferredoxin component